MAEIKYSKAAKRLDELIEKIENEEIDVDELAKNVKEAVSLINACKDKIKKAEMEVRKAVEDFDTKASKEDG